MNIHIHSDVQGTPEHFLRALGASDLEEVPKLFSPGSDNERHLWNNDAFIAYTKVIRPGSIFLETIRIDIGEEDAGTSTLLIATYVQRQPQTVRIISKNSGVDVLLSEKIVQVCHAIHTLVDDAIRAVPVPCR